LKKLFLIILNYFTQQIPSTNPLNKKENKNPKNKPHFSPISLRFVFFRDFK